MEEKLTTKQINHIVRYRWVCFFALALVGLVSQFHRNVMGVIHDDLIRDFQLNSTSYSLLSSMYFYPYVVMQIPSGILCDKLGIRKTIFYGGIATSLGSLIFSISNSFPLLCLGRALVGIGVAPMTVSMQKLASNWFRSRESATINGINSTIGAVAGFLSQAPLAMLISYVSWTKVFFYITLGTVGIYIISVVFIKDKPADMNLPSIAEMEGHADKVKKIKKVSTKKALWNVVRNKNMWPMFLITPVVMGANTVFSGTWGIPYLREVYGLNNIEASTMTSYLMLGTFIGSFSIGRLSDKLLSRKKVMTGILVVIATEWLLIAFGSKILGSSTLLLSIAMFLFGFTTAAPGLCLTTIRELNSPLYVGMAVGLGNTVGMAACAIFPTLCGSIADRYDGSAAFLKYGHVFGFIAILTALSLLVSAFVLKDTHCKYLKPDYVGRKRRTQMKRNL